MRCVGAPEECVWKPGKNHGKCHSCNDCYFLVLTSQMYMIEPAIVLLLFIIISLSIFSSTRWTWNTWHSSLYSDPELSYQVMC
jgi:hypothetical protein